MVVLERGLAEWLESSVESSFDSCENVTKPEDCKEDIMGEVTKWDIPNGLPEDVLNMDELYGATKDGCEQYSGGSAWLCLSPPATPY